MRRDKSAYIHGLNASSPAQYFSLDFDAVRNALILSILYLASEMQPTCSASPFVAVFSLRMKALGREKKNVVNHLMTKPSTLNGVLWLPPAV